MSSSLKLWMHDGDWRPLDTRNGHIYGRGEVKFAYSNAGKILEADTKKVLSALQNFKEGKDSAVLNGSYLPFRRAKPQNRCQHVKTSSCNHCCPNANSRPDHAVPRVRSASIQTVETVDASIQTSPTLPKLINIEATRKKLQPISPHEAVIPEKLQSKLANNVTPKNIQSNPGNKVTTPKHVETSSKPASKTTKRRHSVACYTENPNKKRKLSLTKRNFPKRDNIEVIAKTPIILNDYATVPVNSGLEIIVSDKDIDLMRNYFMEHLNNFNLLKFDEGGNYQFKCLCQLTPIIRIERSKEIYRMLRMDSQDSQDEISQKDFVSNLGLKLISEKSSPQRYRMRKNTRQANDKHSKNNSKSKEEESMSDSETDFEEIKTKMEPKERHEAKPTKKTYRKEEVVPTKTNNVKDTDEDSLFGEIRHSRKNNDKHLYGSSNDGDVISKYQKNKNKTKDIDRTLSESDSDNNIDDNKQNDKRKFKTTLKRNRKPNTSHKNEKKNITKNNQATKHQKIKYHEVDQTLSISDSDSNDDNNKQNDKPNAKTTLEREKKRRGLKPKNYGNGKTGNNTITSNTKKNQIEESSFEISESDSNTEDSSPPRQIQTRRSTINLLDQNELNNSRKRQNIPDNDTQTNSRLRKRQNVTETKRLSQNSEDEFVNGPSKKKLAKTNKQQKPIETVVVNDEQFNSYDNVDINDRNNNMTDSEDNSGKKSKRPQRRINQFIDLSALASDESNSATIKNKSSEIYFSDESDQEVKKNKITSEIKSISKNRTASAASVYRQEYSNLEDHAIVSWVSNGGRARLVNGNRIWQELAEQYFNITSLNRSWHSLRNRYLRSILPRLERMALDSVLVSRLRAAAATGEIKTRNKAPPRRNSIFGLPTRGALSRRAARALSVDEPPTKRQKLDLDFKPPLETNRVLRSSLVTSPEKPSRSPRYSEITRRFAAQNNKDTDSSTPATSKRNSTESENARNKSPETRNARNASKFPKATTSRKQPTNKLPETKRSRNLAETKRNRSVSPETQVATVGNRRKSLRDKFEENKSESATKSRRKSVIHRIDDSNSPVATTSRYKSPDLTKSAQKSSESATKSRRKSVRDRSESPVLTKSAQKSSESATKSRRKSLRVRSDESKSPVLTRSAPKTPESVTKSRRNSLPDRSPLATSSQKSQSRPKFRKLYNPKTGI